MRRGVSRETKCVYHVSVQCLSRICPVSIWLLLPTYLIPSKTIYDKGSLVLASYPSEGLTNRHLRRSPALIYDPNLL